MIAVVDGLQAKRAYWQKPLQTKRIHTALRRILVGWR